MNYTMRLARYRIALNESFARGDAAGAKSSCILYFNMMREMMSKLSDPAQIKVLQTEADRYEQLFHLVAAEGVSPRAVQVLQCLAENRDPSALLKQPAPAPVVSAAAAKARPVAGATSPSLRATAPSTVQAPPPQPIAPIGGEWVADLFARYLPATVTVSTSEGNGTGFFIAENGLLLTNHHVACNSSGGARSSIRITSGDKKIKCSATFIAADRGRDVALLRAELGSKRAPIIPLVSDYGSLRQGMDMMMIGNAFSDGLAPITGTVKFLRNADGDLIYNAPSNNGDSGSPVLSRNGECIGIHKSRGTGNVGFANRQATPAEDIIKLLRRWKEANKF